MLLQLFFIICFCVTWVVFSQVSATKIVTTVTNTFRTNTFISFTKKTLGKSSFHLQNKKNSSFKRFIIQ